MYYLIILGLLYLDPYRAILVPRYIRFFQYKANNKFINFSIKNMYV